MTDGSMNALRRDLGFPTIGSVGIFRGPSGEDNMKHLMYGVDRDTGQVWSRLEGDPGAGDRKIAVPVLEYDKIGEGGDFTKPLTYRLERMDITALIGSRLKWTRKVPVAVKNIHREFWGLKPLPPSGEQS